MRKYYFLLVICLSFMKVNAQFDIYEDFEYESGEPFGDWWYDCPSLCPIIGDGTAHSGTKSAIIDFSSPNGISLDFGDNSTYADIDLLFYMYIPTSKEAYFYFDEDLATAGGSNFVVGHFYFNEGGASPGSGIIKDNYTPTGSEFTFNYPEDEWFPVNFTAEINEVNGDTWGLNVNGTQVVPYGTPLNDIDNNDIDNFGGMAFIPASSETEYYIDTINFTDVILSIEASDYSKFLIYPNPVKSELYIDSEFPVISARIYSLNGIVVSETSSVEQIDVSGLSAGIYFVEIENSSGKMVQQFVKK